MARIKSTTFKGAPMVDVDVDAPTFTRVIRDAIGDTALAYDKATGSNGETSTMIHDGAGRGSLLGVPNCNQWIRAPLALDGTTPSGGGKNGGDGLTYLGVAPLYVELGETLKVIEVQGEGLEQLEIDVVLMSVVGVELQRVPLGFGDGEGVYRATLLGLTRGEFIIAFVGTTVVGPASLNAGVIASVAIHPGRLRVGGASPPGRNTDDVIGVTDPGTAPIAWRDIDSAFVSNAGSLNAWHLATLNRNQNGLLEYLTGWPAGDDLSYVHADSGVTDPVRSEFGAHVRAGFANEPRVDFPLMMEFLGAAKVDGYLAVEAAEPPSFGMLEWYAPWPLTSAALPVDVVKQLIRLPDFDPADYTLHVSVIALKGNGFAGTWSISIDVGGGTVAANFAVVGSTNLVRAKATLPTWTPDNTNNVNIGITRTVGVRNIDEIAILGFAFWFTPT